MGMSDLNERLNQLEQGALNFLFPRRCPFCNQHIGNKELICVGCEKKLPYTGDRAVRQTSWGRVAAPLYYEDAVRRAILDFKFKGRMGGLPCFGSLTARRAAEEPREDNLVQGDEREKLSRQRQRNALETQLRHAVETENFEEAAKLRDQLRSLPQA